MHIRLPNLANREYSVKIGRNTESIGTTRQQTGRDWFHPFVTHAKVDPDPTLSNFDVLSDARRTFRYTSRYRYHRNVNFESLFSIEKDLFDAR